MILKDEFNLFKLISLRFIYVRDANDIDTIKIAFENEVKCFLLSSIKKFKLLNQNVSNEKQ